MRDEVKALVEAAKNAWALLERIAHGDAYASGNVPRVARSLDEAISRVEAAAALAAVRETEAVGVDRLNLSFLRAEVGTLDALIAEAQAEGGSQLTLMGLRSRRGRVLEELAAAERAAGVW